MKKYILVNVPIDATDFYINNIGCLRFSLLEGRLSSCLEPIEIGEYLENDKHIVVGESTLNEKRYVVIEIINTDKKNNVD